MGRPRPVGPCCCGYCSVVSQGSGATAVKEKVLDEALLGLVEGSETDKDSVGIGGVVISTGVMDGAAER